MTFDLDELERLEREATGGRWETHFCDVKGWMVLGICADVMPTDAALIAAARNALPALLARVRELEDRAKVYEEKWYASNRSLHVLWKEAEKTDAELRALRALAEAASDMATVHLDFALGGPADDAGAAVSLYQLRAALDAWRGLR